jgi:membrane AbrB-like protein
VNFLDTMALSVAGGLAGRATRIPAGVLLGPLVIGGVLNGLGWINIELPPVLLIASYAVIGWSTGLRFTRDVLATAARALPQSIGATALLMLFCGFISWMLVLILHVDPLSAYLAASPGGVDVAAVIAASTKVDTPFVMVIQSVRAVVLIIVGPQLARWAAKMVK